MDMDVLDAQFAAEFQVAVGHGIGELPAAGAVVPHSGVELEAADGVLLAHAAEGVEPGLAPAGVEGDAEDEAIGVLLDEGVVLLVGVEAVGEELAEVGGVEDAPVELESPR